MASLSTVVSSVVTTSMMNLTDTLQPWLNDTDSMILGANDSVLTTALAPVLKGPDCSSGKDFARYVTEVVISLPIALLGIIGNVLAFIVLCRQKQRLTTTLLLQGLAVADTLVLISIMLGRCLRILAMCNDWKPYLKIFPELFRWMYPLSYFFRLADVWLVTLLTIDRWIAVCKPLHAQRLCTLSRAYKQMAGVTLAAMIVTLPRFVEFSTNEHGQIAVHWISKVQAYTIIYRIILFGLFMYIIPMVLLMILNTKLLKTLHKADIYRAALRESRNQTTGCVSGFRSITWMVTVVVITCMLCNVLALVSHILYSLEVCFRHLNHIKEYRRYISLASNVMMTINSAINFVIYYMCSKTFRQSFARTFCSCPCKKTISGARASKRLSGAPFSSGSGTGLMYISLPQLGDRRKNNVQSTKPGEDMPNTPPPALLNKVNNNANGSSGGHGSRREQSLRESMYKERETKM